MDLFAVAALAATSLSVVGAPTLEEGFRTPPDSAKPHTWYHMMNGNVTKEGITCDFEALAKAGVGGVQMFDAGCNVPPGPLAFNSPAWFDMFRHAASEARRLGLEICIPNCSGWSSSGGPWNMPSNAMKVVTFREVKAKGPSKFHAKLPREAKDNGYYEDVAVVAFPTPPANLVTFPDVKAKVEDQGFVLSSEKPFTAAGVSFDLQFEWAWIASTEVRIETSADGRVFTELESRRMPLAESGSNSVGRRLLAFPKTVTAKAVRVSFRRSSRKLTIANPRPERGLTIPDVQAKTFGIRQDVSRCTSSTDASQVVAKAAQVDLSGRVAADGTLDWDVPAGDWTILRIGAVCNGRHNHPASQHGVGLEVDKLSASAMDYHFSQYVTRLCDRLGPLAGNVASGFNNILVDSYEVGSQNWTQGLDRIFEVRRGYSMRPYLPVFAGHVVGSMDESERFLEDFRRVVADLFAENYAGRLAELCHRHGLKLSVEPYGNCPADNLQYGEAVDIPMGEFWSRARYGNHGGGVGNSKFVSHLAHVWGRRFVGTESFTASPDVGGRWLTTPWSIKSQGDKAFAKGVNRIIYHRFTHQPWPGRQYLPGMTMGRWGMHLDRTQTWWNDFAPEWLRYQARCQWMLQEGTFVADVLFFCGEQAPNQGGNTDGASRASDMTLPPGYDFDVCATKAMHLLKVVDGDVVVPGGVRYRLLVLPPSETMTADMLRTVGRLLDAGARVCCLRKPSRSPGLRGYPNADAEVAKLADEVWAKGVLCCPPAEALAKLGVAPDFVCEAKDPEANWIHRRAAGADWYFVARDNASPCRFEVSLREKGREPEIWDAVSGTMRPASVWREENGRTVVSLDFPESGSAFVVLRKPAAGSHLVKADVAVSPRKDPTDGGPRPVLKIVRARYGVFAEDARKFCMEVTRSLCPGKPVRVTNATFGGDPAPMQVKRMEVLYALNGEKRRDLVPEWKDYTLPTGAADVRAWYGLVADEPLSERDLVVDIADRLTACIRNGRLVARIDNKLAGRDPAVLQKKKLVVTYDYDGEKVTRTLPEGETLEIPQSGATVAEPPDWEWRDGRLLAWQPLSAELKAADGTLEKVKAEPPAAELVTGAWEVRFPAGWDAPDCVTFPALKSWTAMSVEGVRYFSGTATYRKKLSVRPPASGERVMLDLGDVRNFAEVKVNGRRVALLWKPPYRADITEALGQKGDVADLEVRVTNLWANRLIGDDRQFADDCTWQGSVVKGVKEIGVREIPQWVKDGKPSPTGRHTFTTWKHWDKDDELLPSGLLGPVLIRRGVSANAL